MTKNSKSSDPLAKGEFQEFVRKEFSPLNRGVNGLKQDVNGLKEDFQEFREKQDQMSNTLDKVFGLIQESRDEQDINRARIEALEDIHPNHQHAGV